MGVSKHMNASPPLLIFCSPHVTRSHSIFKMVKDSLAEKDTPWSSHRRRPDSAFRHSQTVWPWARCIGSLSCGFILCKSKDQTTLLALLPRGCVYEHAWRGPACPCGWQALSEWKHLHLWSSPNLCSPSLWVLRWSRGAGKHDHPSLQMGNWRLRRGWEIGQIPLSEPPLEVNLGIWLWVYFLFPWPEYELHERRDLSASFPAPSPAPQLLASQGHCFVKLCLRNQCMSPAFPPWPVPRWDPMANLWWTLKPMALTQWPRSTFVFVHSFIHYSLIHCWLLVLGQSDTRECVLSLTNSGILKRLSMTFRSPFMDPRDVSPNGREAFG